MTKICFYPNKKLPFYLPNKNYLKKKKNPNKDGTCDTKQYKIWAIFLQKIHNTHQSVQSSIINSHVHII